MPRKKKEQGAPKDLHPLYIKYYEEQTHLKPSTLQTLVDRLRSFPKNPDDLTPDYFRQRMKKVSPHTLKAEVAIGKRFLEWASRDISGFKKLKLPRREETVTVEDLYTQEELDTILANLTNYRDHALISVLYESACRVGELCSMTVENLHFEPERPIVTAIVKGKTGTREVYLMESVPSLNRWLNLHPTGTGKLWVDERKGHRPITRHTVDSIVRASLRKSGLEKKKVVHMFRHTRLTELVRKGVRGQTLSKIAGWTKRSNMESVYVHLSTQDIKNEIALKVFGLDGEEKPAKPIFESATCPNCGKENPSGTKYCEKCGLPLADHLILEQLTRKTVLEEQVAGLQDRVMNLEILLGKQIKRQVQREEEQGFEAPELPLDKPTVEKLKKRFGDDWEEGTLAILAEHLENKKSHDRKQSKK